MAFGSIIKNIQNKYAEVVTKVFAVMNIIASSIISIALVILFIYVLNINYQSNLHWNDTTLMGNIFDGFLASVIFVAIVILLPVTLVWCTFSLILTIGLFKRRPGMVLAYFIYGVVTTTISFIFVGLGAESHKEIFWAYVLGFTAVYIIYSAILAMIWAMYSQMKDESQYKHSTLINMENVPYSEDVNKRTALTAH